jgi:predicted glycosyl hydrolase (DUF1957 family)
MQLITVPDSNLHSYFKKGKVGDNTNAEERLEEWENVDNAIKEFVRLFVELTGNEFEPWEREKKFEKKRLCFYPIDMVQKCFCYNSLGGLIFYLAFSFIYICRWMDGCLIGNFVWIG